jgi:outer membrane receptor protein involved in Fe transport
VAPDRLTGRRTPPPESVPLVRGFLCAWLVTVLAVPPALASDKKEKEEGVRKVTGKELVAMGFFQDFEELDLESLLKPQEVAVSVASRSPQPIEQAPAAVSLVRSEEIRDLGVRTLEELLRLLPGVDVTTDNLGRPRIEMRGIPSGRTRGGSETVLILLDGQRLNEDVTGGATNLNLDLPLLHVKQVEVLRGPAAALYGDGAFAGVISIVLDSTAEFMGTELGAGGGSFGTQEYALRSGGILGGVQISGYVRFKDTSGAQLPVPRDAQSIADQSLDRPISVAPGTTSDDFNSLDASYRFSLREASLGWHTKSEKSKGYIGMADSLGRQNDLTRRQFGMDVTWGHVYPRLGTVEARGAFLKNEDTELLEVYPSGYRLVTSEGSSDFGEPGGLGGVFLQTSLKSSRYTGEALVHRQLAPAHQLTTGLTLEHVSAADPVASGNLDFRTNTPVPPATGSSLGPLVGAVQGANRNIFGLQAQDVWSRSATVQLTAGLRLDHYSDVGTSLNPRLSLVGALPAWLQKPLPAALEGTLSYRLGYARAFRAPALAELYYDLPGWTANPDLQPTTANSFEAALLYKHARLTAEATGFLILTGSAIATERPFDPVGTARLVNQEGVRASGLELQAAGGFGQHHTFFANYTFQRSRDRGSDLPVPGLPSHLANFGMTFVYRERVDATAALSKRSQRPRAPGDPRAPVSGYAIVNLNIRVKRIYKTLEANLAFQNLFDKAYFDPSLPGGVPGDYPRLGRRVLIHAALRF